MHEKTTPNASPAEDAPPKFIPVVVRRPWGLQTLTWFNASDGPNREQRRAVLAQARRRRAR